MKPSKLPSSVQSAYDTLEHVFFKYFNTKAGLSNRHPVGDPKRVEHDLSVLEKSHIELFQSRLNATIAQEILRAMAESSAENARLAKKIFWLNVAVAVLTVVLAGSAVLELSQ